MMHSVASVPPLAIRTIKWAPFSNDVMAKNVKSWFYDCDYFIFCLFPAIILPHRATHNRDRSNSWHGSPRNKTQTKELSLEYCVCGLRPAANEVNGNSSCVVGCRVTSPSRVNGGRKMRQGEDMAGFILRGSVLASCEQGGNEVSPHFTFFWNRPHTSPIMMMRFFSSFHHLPIFKYFLKGRLSSRKASCFKSWWSSSPESFCFGRSGGVFPLLIAGDFLSSPGNILLSELWLSGKTSLQWLLDVFFPLDFYIWSMQTVSNLKLHIKYFDSILRHCTWCSI